MHKQFLSYFAKELDKFCFFPDLSAYLSQKADDTFTWSKSEFLNSFSMYKILG